MWAGMAAGMTAAGRMHISRRCTISSQFQSHLSDGGDELRHHSDWKAWETGPPEHICGKQFICAAPWKRVSVNERKKRVGGWGGAGRDAAGRILTISINFFFTRSCQVAPPSGNRMAIRDSQVCRHQMYLAALLPLCTHAIEMNKTSYSTQTPTNAETSRRCCQCSKACFHCWQHLLAERCRGLAVGLCCFLASAAPHCRVDLTGVRLTGWSSLCAETVLAG
jgi:hypothetical protein